MPNKARYYFGAPNYGNTDWHRKDSFNDEQTLQARIAVMVSQIGRTETKYYDSLLPEDVGDLKVVNREKLEEMFENRVDGGE